MTSHADILIANGIVVAALMFAVWLLSLRLKNASIVDVAWGLGFVAIAWSGWIIGDGEADRANLLVAMTTIWGVRLAAHLYWRNRGQGEDYRYQSMRRHQGASFPLRSFVTVFVFQGVVMFVVSLPIQLAMTPQSPKVGPIAVVGVVIWGIGVFFETVGDSQLVRFKANPDNDGKVMDQGLWRYTRHPNYFGDFCVWWGLWVVAAEATDARVAIIGPVLMTFMLTKVSGVPILERRLHKRRTGYDQYVAQTSGFFPRPPKVAAESAAP